MERSAQAMPSSLANFYGGVVQDVIHNLRPDFEVDGVDESVLDELQTLWETKLKNANVLPADYRRPVCSPKLNLNANPAYEGEGWTPTVDNVFPETPGIVNTPVNTPGLVNTPGILNTPVQAHVSTVSTPLLSIPEKQGNFSYHAQRQLAGDNLTHSLDFMPPPSMSSRETNMFDMNEVYVENGEEMYNYSQNEPPETKDYMDLSSGNKRKRDYYSSFSQLDGAADVVRPSCLVVAEERVHADMVIANIVESKYARTPAKITQLDGNDDNYNDHVTEEDYNLPGEEDPAGVLDGDVKPVKEEGLNSEESEPPLNEEDDVEDVTEEDEKSKTDNLVVAQFEKVTKVKGKWKCILKDGIVQLNKKEYLFSKANGEFDFF